LGVREQPGLEAAARIVFEIARLHFFRDGDHGGLDHLLRLGVVEAGLARDAVNQPPIAVEEFLPAFLVVPVFEPGEETAARREPFVLKCLLVHVLSVYTGAAGVVLQEIAVVAQASGLRQVPPSFQLGESLRAKRQPGGSVAQWQAGRLALLPRACDAWCHR